MLINAREMESEFGGIKEEEDVLDRDSQSRRDGDVTDATVLDCG